MSLFRGKNISFSIFGQSHADGIGIVIDGIPPGTKIDTEKINKFLKRRAPSAAVYSTPRSESDAPVFLSGILDGYATGNSICAAIFNKDALSSDYRAILNTPRPGHADFCARVKQGGFEDTRGGGAFSGRLTAPLCIMGAIAKEYLAERGIIIGSHILSIGGIRDGEFDPVNISEKELSLLEHKEFRTLSDEKGGKMLEIIREAGMGNNSVGGVIECAAVGEFKQSYPFAGEASGVKEGVAGVHFPSNSGRGMPIGLGGELFDGLESKIARLIFAVPAVKGFEIGSGFKASQIYGSENNDEFYFDSSGGIKTYTNNHGGLLGGMTSGMPLIIRAAIKPTSSIALRQRTVDLKTRSNSEIEIKGRHDACIVPRALPVIESCVAIALFDEML